jgi:hypothetical protein
MVKFRKHLKTIFLILILIVLFQILWFLWYSYSSPSFPEYQSYKNSPKINFVIPTVYRRRNGHNYLIKTFTSIYELFSKNSINFHVYAFEKEGQANPPFKHSRFHYETFTHYKIPTRIKVESDRDKKILKQNLDWISMMVKYRKMCQPGEIFIYLEDDFVFCENSLAHVLGAWNYVNNENVYGIKFSYGLSGNILRCEQIESIVIHAVSKCFIKDKPPYVIE